MNFDAYLISKKIDPVAFKAAESSLWEAWETEFNQMHPNSFTVQKLNLINPIRRKYPLKEMPEVKPAVKKEENAVQKSESIATTATTPATAKPAARPVFKPKPKIN